MEQKKTYSLAERMSKRVPDETLNRDAAKHTHDKSTDEILGDAQGEAIRDLRHRYRDGRLVKR